MTLATNDQQIETLTPEEFVIRVRAMSRSQTPDDYFVVNNATGKLELHFAKETYLALDADAKARIKRTFVWGRNSGCWISRSKEPNLYAARDVAKSLGLFDAGKSGERMSFADQMERKAERAERRADRYEHRADAAEKRGEALQAPINHMHGDIAFFTQPNINTSAGRAFTKQRERMWASFERGFEEFNKSSYWKDRAQTARATAGQKELQDKGFLMRRIKERESILRKLHRNIEEYNGLLAAVDAAAVTGETPRDIRGWEIKSSHDEIQHQIDLWFDRIEVRLDELGFYQDCLDALGGIRYSRETLKNGDLVYIGRWKKAVRYLRGGPQNFTYEFTEPHMKLANGAFMQGKASYAEIQMVVRPIPDRPGCYESI